jgi:hypothetical protein
MASARCEFCEAAFLWREGTACDLDVICQAQCFSTSESFSAACVFRTDFAQDIAVLLTVRARSLILLQSSRLCEKSPPCGLSTPVYIYDHSCVMRMPREETFLLQPDPKAHLSRSSNTLLPIRGSSAYCFWTDRKPAMHYHGKWCRN